jgi:hypothetical protein
MTDWNPLIQAVAALIVALALAVPGILAWLSAKRVESKTDTVLAKTEAASVVTVATLAEAKGIAHSVNSTSSLASAKIESMEQRIARLMEQLAHERETAVLLAQSAAVVSVVAPLAATVEIAAPTKTVEAPVIVTAPKVG